MSGNRQERFHSCTRGCTGQFPIYLRPQLFSPVCTANKPLVLKPHHIVASNHVYLSNLLASPVILFVVARGLYTPTPAHTRTHPHARHALRVHAHRKHVRQTTNTGKQDNISCGHGLPRPHLQPDCWCTFLLRSSSCMLRSMYVH